MFGELAGMRQEIYSWGHGGQKKERDWLHVLLQPWWNMRVGWQNGRMAGVLVEVMQLQPN